MRWLSLSIRLLFLPLLLCLTAGAATASGIRADLAAVLRDDKPFLLIVAPVGGGKAVGSDAYADWVAYRDEFLHAGANELRVVTLSPLQYRASISQPDLADDFTTLFIRRGREALVHNGMVLEPRIYILGSEFLSSGTLPPDAAAYDLQARDFRLRQQK